MMDSPSILPYKVFVDVMFNFESFRDTLWDGCLFKTNYSNNTFERIHDEVEYYDHAEPLIQEVLDNYEFSK